MTKKWKTNVPSVSCDFDLASSKSELSVSGFVTVPHAAVTSAEAGIAMKAKQKPAPSPQRKAKLKCSHGSSELPSGFKFAQANYIPHWQINLNLNGTQLHFSTQMSAQIVVVKPTHTLHNNR